MSKFVKYSKAEWIRDGMEMGIIFEHKDTPAPIMQKMASSRDDFVGFCDRHGIDPDQLMEVHRRRMVLADTQSARTTLRKMGVSASREDIDMVVASAAVLEKVAFLGSIKKALGFLATFGMGRILKWGSGIALIAGLVYYLGKAGFLGSPKSVDESVLKAAKKAGVPNAEKVMPYAAAMASDQEKLQTVKQMTAVLCRTAGRCGEEGTMSELMKLLKNKEGKISPYAVAGLGAAAIPAAAGVAGIATNIVKSVIK